MLKKLVPFGAAVILAFLVVAFVRLVEAEPGVTYALIGFVGGVLLVVGTRFAFADGGFEGGQRMESDEPAPVADQDESADATTRHLVVFAGEDDSGFVDARPEVRPAGRAVAGYVETIESVSETFVIGHPA